MPSAPALEPTPPSEVLDAARKASDGVFSSFGRWLRRSSPVLVPLHVFVVDLEALLEPERLGVLARPAGWRFQSATAREPEVPGGAPERASSGRSRRSRPKEPLAIEVAERPLDVWIERGPTIGGVQRVLAEAQQLREQAEDEGIDQAVFEPRMLRVPEAHLTAVWFRNRQGSGEAVVPIAPAPSEFVAFHRYPAADFLQTAASLARRKLADYASAEGEVGELGG
jgi:hypothetical protein